MGKTTITKADGKVSLTTGLNWIVRRARLVTEIRLSHPPPGEPGSCQLTFSLEDGSKFSADFVSEATCLHWLGQKRWHGKLLVMDHNQFMIGPLCNLQRRSDLRVKMLQEGEITITATADDCLSGMEAFTKVWRKLEAEAPSVKTHLFLSNCGVCLLHVAYDPETKMSVFYSGK